ncbi:hypothetical protein B5G52_07925 [Pseudoalteromonas sp. A601]|uniref:winged helix-turn-helix transcriptional regulator n=1 Tax=Pseudoalteromonas sp. A601 TaxID=1967839 RepID=UPI000B3CB6D3|nr:winged helix-turn-helix transcriptional regulator [Pseudoalteromonas sp. A601]OUS72639.1 hypothetical protein B5G52_07925 [Pseudoalteromonas sp. A601]
MQFIYINNELTVQVKFESVTLLTTAQFNNLIDNVFINTPVESMVHQHQDDYYFAIRQSTQQTDSAPFIEFMLQMIFAAITEAKTSETEGLNAGLSEGLKLSDVDKTILAFIEQDRYITNVQLAEKSGKSQSTIERRIKVLKDARLITRIGAKKTGYRQVKR